MSIENIRKGKNLSDYRTALNTTSSSFAERADSLRSQDPIKKGKRAIRLEKHISRIREEIASIDSAVMEDVYILPDGQLVDDVSYDPLQVLLYLPTKAKTAVSLEELAHKSYALELRDGEIDVDQAKINTLTSVNKLKDRLGAYGWDVQSVHLEDKSREDEEKKSETRYFLSPVVESSTSDSKSDEEDESDDSFEFKSDILLVQNPTRDEHRRHAQDRISSYLDTPGEKVLRQHQLDVFESLLTNFDSGKTSGTIILPTGAGKTHVAAELIKVLGLQTIVFSSSKDILAQNGVTIAGNNPDLVVTNFFGDTKDLSGHVINSLYQSFPALVRSGTDLKRFGLVVYDEADLSLGEERHKMHSQFPNAIKIALTATPYFEQLKGYEERGIIDPEAEWLETFTNTIHEMSVEEAFERGVIPPLDIHLVRTNTVVPNISLGVDGDFNPAQMARHLNTRSRNALILAMIGGLDTVPAGVNISSETKQEIEKIHGKIKGKSTVVHGMNVAHILWLEKELLKLGVTAEAVYGEMKGDRKAAIERVKNGETQIVLGDQLTGRGLDIPGLEVGIHAAPTLSSRELVQEVGRLFRHSPETGKQKGIVVQLVDTHHAQKVRQPVLVPSIFDPNFVLRGASHGKEVQKSEGKDSKRGSTKIPALSIEGTIDLDAYFEEMKLQDILQSRFKNAELDEVNTILNSIYAAVAEQYTDDISLFDLYSEFAQQLPAKVSLDINQKAMVAIASGKPDEIRMGTQVLLAVNLKSIMKVTEQYLTGNNDFDNELIQNILTDIHERMDRFHDRHAISSQIHSASNRIAGRHISDRLGIPANWVNRGIYRDVIATVDKLLTQYPSGMDKAVIDEQAGVIGNEFAINERTVKSYLLERNNMSFHGNTELNNPDPTFDEVFIGLSKQMIEDVLASLTARERHVVSERFFEERTYEDVSKDFGVTRERIRQIEAKAIRKITHPSRSKHLKDL